MKLSQMLRSALVILRIFVMIIYQEGMRFGGLCERIGKPQKQTGADAVSFINYLFGRVVVVQRSVSRTGRRTTPCGNIKTV